MQGVGSDSLMAGSRIHHRAGMATSVLSEMWKDAGLQCPTCGKVFSSRNKRQDLQRHLLSHSGERPFACPYCSYRASLKGNLKKHITVLHAALIQQDAYHEGSREMQLN